MIASNTNSVERQQPRPVDRAGRDPRGRHRRHVAGRRPLLADRHAHRRAVHHRRSRRTIPNIGIPAETNYLFKARRRRSRCACSSRRRRARAAPRAPYRRPPSSRRQVTRHEHRTPSPPPASRPGTASARFTPPSRYLPVLATLALFVGMFGAGGIRYEGFADPQVVPQPAARQRVPDRARRRHDVRDPHRRHRPVGRLGGGAVHDDRGQDACELGWSPYLVMAAVLLSARSSAC